MSLIPPMPGFTPEAIAAWGTWLSGASGLLAPVLTGAIAWWIGRKERIGKLQTLEQDHQKAAEAEAAAVIDAITRRFQALIDGYEARVKDLLNEIQSLRNQVTELRDKLFPVVAEEKHNGPAKNNL